jgi:phosphoribosylglycinamide formyltransferase-1
MLDLAVLVSGRGSNMLRLAAAIDEMQLEARITTVIANVDCDGITHAKARGIDSYVIRRRDHDSRAAHEAALAACIDQSGADIVCLAGYMAILGADFVNRYQGRMINIHPSLLPAYKGLDTHQRAINDGAVTHGATVHLVTPELDAGPIIAQAELDIDPADDATSLAGRVLQLEHQLYPFIVASLANGQLTLQGNTPRWTNPNNAIAAMPDHIRQILEPALILQAAGTGASY